MSAHPPTLSHTNQTFCFQIADFCRQHHISVRELSRMCFGTRTKFSSAAAHRLLTAACTDRNVEHIRPFLADALTNYLIDDGYTPSQVEAELSRIFEAKEYEQMIANRCPLSPEAARFHGLRHDPFDVDVLPAPEDIYTNAEIDSVVARVKDAVLYQRFIAVVGGVGTGKTLLKLRVAGELEEVEKKAKLLYPEFFDMEELTVPNIANAILAELGQTIPNDKSKRVTKMKDTLTQLQQEGIGVAIVLDECHRLRDKVISSLKNFWEMTNGRSSRLLGVILFGQPQFVDARLRDIKFREIRQRVQIIEMPPLDDSSREYIAHRLRLAGGDIDTLFDPRAIDRIAINATTPLAIGNLCNEALMEAFRLEERQVSAAFEMFKNLSNGRHVLGMRRAA